METRPSGPRRYKPVASCLPPSIKGKVCAVVRDRGAGEGPQACIQRQFRSPAVSWRSMALAYAVPIAVLWIVEAVFDDPEDWVQHLASAVFAIGAGLIWAARGLVIAAMTPWRRASPRVERIVNLAVVVATCVGSLFLATFAVDVAVRGA